MSLQLLSVEEFSHQVPTAAEYEKAFRVIEQELPKNAISMLCIHYDAPNHTLTASEMAAAMNYANYGAANLQYGKLGALLGNALDFRLRYGVNMLCHFVQPGAVGNAHWLWIMWPQVAEALCNLGWVQKAGEGAI